MVTAVRSKGDLAHAPSEVGPFLSSNARSTPPAKIALYNHFEWGDVAEMDGQYTQHGLYPLSARQFSWCALFSRSFDNGNDNDNDGDGESERSVRLLSAWC